MINIHGFAVVVTAFGFAVSMARRPPAITQNVYRKIKWATRYASPPSTHADGSLPLTDGPKDEKWCSVLSTDYT